MPSPTDDAFATTLQLHAGPVRGRLARLTGDHALAEDLWQDTALRAWAKAPRDAPAAVLVAWLHRTATRLGIDELRRRGRRPTATLDALAGVVQEEPEGAQDARAALAALTPHQRLVLLLRFELGLELSELGALLGVGPDAARKRVARARAAFAAALHEERREDDRPTVLVLMGADDVGPYRAWLEAAGARVRVVDGERSGLDLAGADALVLSGSVTDLHPRTYGAARDPRTVEPSFTRDLRDMAVLRAALAEDLPVVGVCRGAQLLGALSGGALDQHVEHHGGDVPHGLVTAPDSAVRRAYGTAPEIVSAHHQAVRSTGPGVRVTATAPDGLIEAVEVPGRRLALGTQWHPERGGGEGLAQLIVDEAAA